MVYQPKGTKLSHW